MMIAGARQGSVAVTGASSGIGRACALHLDRIGYQVLAGIRKESDAEALRQSGSERLTPIRLDVTDSGSIAEAADVVRREVGGNGLLGLVNNAGIAVGGPLEFLPLEDMRRLMEVNLIGTLAVTQALLPLLRSGRGRIVNIGSVSGRVAAPFLGPYAASKFALEAMSDALRLEVAPWGIYVAMVEPGAVDTPIWGKALSEDAERLSARPEIGRTLYGRAVEAVRRHVEATAESGMPAQVVAEAVAHALCARRPKARYHVGRGLRLRVAFLTAIPTRWRDKLIQWGMGLEGEGGEMQDEN